MYQDPGAFLEASCGSPEFVSHSMVSSWAGSGGPVLAFCSQGRYLEVACEAVFGLCGGGWGSLRQGVDMAMGGRKTGFAWLARRLSLAHTALHTGEGKRA